MKGRLFAPLLLTLACLVYLAAEIDGFSGRQPESQSRRDLLELSTATLVASVLVTPKNPVFAFDGQGSSSYSGRTPSTLAAKAKAYRDRIAADVKDFNSLGAAIDRGETSGDAWIAFFTQYQRREADFVGRMYAAQVDLTGLNNSGGGAGLLLSTTYAKPNKPPDNQFTSVQKVQCARKDSRTHQKCRKSRRCSKGKTRMDKGKRDTV